MTWSNRFRMFFGLIAVTLLVVALTVALSHRKGEAVADSASIDAIVYPVGTDYAGTVIEQFVVEGDLIAVGDPVARIQSTQLMRDIDDEITVPASDVYLVNDDATITVFSSIDGLVQEVVVPQGGYVAGGTTVATVAALASLYVSAEFVLDPADFDRIEPGAAVEVLLPNDVVLDGTVDSIEVETDGGDAIATVAVSIDETQFETQGDLMKPGTPVTATMQLRNDDLLASLVLQLREFIADVRGALFA